MRRALSHMGSAPSSSALTQARYDEAGARAAVGDAFDKGRFDAAATDGFVSNAELAHAVAAARAPPATAERTVVNMGVSIQIPNGPAPLVVGVSCSVSADARVVHSGVRCDACGQDPIVGPRFTTECFGATSNLCRADYAALDAAAAAVFAEVAVHVGMKCDSCGAHPILGPRYSRDQYARNQHDLCRGCYGTLDPGAAAAYEAIAAPIPLETVVRRTVEREAALVDAALPGGGPYPPA